MTVAQALERFIVSHRTVSDAHLRTYNGPRMTAQSKRAMMMIPTLSILIDRSRKMLAIESADAWPFSRVIRDGALSPVEITFVGDARFYDDTRKSPDNYDSDGGMQVIFLFQLPCRRRGKAKMKLWFPLSSPRFSCWCQTAHGVVAVACMPRPHPPLID